ncbi:MAG: hypothetical protein AB7I29_13925 [Geobacter sp.]
MATIADVKRKMENPFPASPEQLATEDKLLNSPLAKAGKWTGRQAIAGVAAVPAAAMDVANKAANTVNWALGGDPNYFATNNTEQALAIANPSQPKAPPVANSAAPSPAPSVDPLAAIKAKDAAITNTRTVPTDAGITQDMVQRPTGGAAPGIAGVQKFSFSKRQPAGGVVANNSRSDWSPGSTNVRAIAGGVDKYGRSYDEQVAHAAQVNDTTMRSLATLTPREKAEAGILEAQRVFAGSGRRGKPSKDFNPVTMANAASEVAGATSRIKALEGGFADKQAQTIAGMKEQGDKYRADQQLVGTKYMADANLKAHEAAAQAGLDKAKIAGQEKQREQANKDYADRVKSLIGDWSKLNLPAEYVPKLNEYARYYVAAEDPQSNTFMMPPNREGGMYAALPRQYENIYQTYLQSMGHKDAAARVYDMAKKRGHAIDVPDFRRFLPTADAIRNQNQTDAIRNQNQTLIAGVQ